MGDWRDSVACRRKASGPATTEEAVVLLSKTLLPLEDGLAEMGSVRRIKEAVAGGLARSRSASYLMYHFPIFLYSLSLPRLFQSQSLGVYLRSILFEQFFLV